MMGFGWYVWEQYVALVRSTVLDNTDYYVVYVASTLTFRYCIPLTHSLYWFFMVLKISKD